jgi:hypothetical protein
VAFFPFYGKRISHRQLVITTDAKSFFFYCFHVPKSCAAAAAAAAVENDYI